MKLFELMLYREAGGVGYNVAIAKYAKDNPDEYERIMWNIKAIKKDVEDL